MDLGFGKAVQVDHLTPHEVSQIERVLDRAERRLEVEDSDSPIDHIKAGHIVAAWWPSDTKGYLTLFADAGEDAGPQDIDIYDTEIGDADVTDEIRCDTCDITLDLFDENGDAYV